MDKIPDPSTQPSPEVATISHRHFPWRWLMSGGLGVAALAALVWFGYITPAQRAAKRYQQRLSSSSLSYSGSLEFYGSDFLSGLDSKLNFAGQYQRQPLTGQLNFSGTWGKKITQGQAVVDNGRLNFKLTGTQLPVLRYKQSEFLLPLQPVWYSTRLDDSAFDSICDNAAPPKANAELELYRQARNLKIQPAWWVNFWADQNGRRTTHLSGQIPSAQLPQLLSAVEAAMPAGCGLNTLGLTPNDSRSWQVHYDLWANSAADQLQLLINDKSLGSRFSLTLVTSGSGRPVYVIPPTETIDLNQIYSHVKLQY